MKLSIIGLGQCGCNIADEFYHVNNYSRSILGQRIRILTDVFAINTDETDLGGLKHIPKDKSHRILIGTAAALGHGVGKINTDAVNIIKSSNLAVSDTILRSPKFHECDAIIAITSGGGGTGSGTIGWMIKSLKERTNKPIYAIIVLPFAFEERGNTSYAVMNTAICINTVNRYADAIFLIDNERYRRAGNAMARDLEQINQEIAWSFYDLCCAGEENNRKHVGSKVLDAGDIKQSLKGMTSIGRGQFDLPAFRFRQNGYREGIRDQSLVYGALRHGESNTSLSIDLNDARRLLILISAPRDAITVNTMEEISNDMQAKAPLAVIRTGDYPRRGRSISATIVASQLTKVPRVERLFVQAEDLLARKEATGRDTEIQIEKMVMLGSSLPTLD